MRQSNKKTKYIIGIVILLVLAGASVGIWLDYVKPRLATNLAITQNQARIKAREGEFAQANLGMLEKIKKSNENLLAKLKENPNDVPNWFQLGTNKKNLGDYMGAEEALQKAIELDKESINALSNLGVLYIEWGRYSEAEQTFKKMTERQPKMSEGYLRLSELYESGKYGTKQQAEDILIIGLTNIPEHPSILFALAEYYQAQGDKAKAITYYERLLPAAPQNKAAIEEIIKELKQ
jgi:cytochrome c-type biogenesis protein CcmH/NrfG